MDLATQPLPKRILIVLTPRYYELCLQIMTLINLYRYLFKVQILFFVDACAENIGVVNPTTRETIYGTQIIKFIIETLLDNQLTGYEFSGEIKICHYSPAHTYEHVHGFSPDADIYVANSSINGVANPNLSYFV